MNIVASYCPAACLSIDVLPIYRSHIENTRAFLHTWANLRAPLFWIHKKDKSYCSFLYSSPLSLFSEARSFPEISTAPANSRNIPISCHCLDPGPPVEGST